MSWFSISTHSGGSRHTTQEGGVGPNDDDDGDDEDGDSNVAVLVASEEL